MSEGLEGRSGNPVAVLFDTLLHPNADFGYEFPPVLQWRQDKQQQIPHLVLGRATPGGAWHVRNFFPPCLCQHLHIDFNLSHKLSVTLEWHLSPVQSVPLFPQAMEGSMLTISLGIWMELPGVNYRDMTNGKRRYFEKESAGER